jgi:hypothetical protein
MHLVSSYVISAEKVFKEMVKAESFEGLAEEQIAKAKYPHTG